jgi:lambda family phage tail tape measure protein
VAFVVDVFDGLTRVVQIVGKAIAATAADVTSFVGGFAGLGITFKQGGLDAVKSQISGAFSEIKSHGDEFSKDLDAILGKQFFSDKLASEFAARDAGQKTPTEKPRNVALGLGEKVGNGSSAFENFLLELERQATKLESGLIPELTLKAQQMASKEGKDAVRAAPGIAAVQAAEEKKFADQYVDSLKKQSEAQDFSLLLVGKTAHEQELLNIQHKVDVDLQVALQNETRKLGPLTEETQQKMATATQQAANKMIAAANARYDAERKWETGAKSAMQSYIEIAGNAAAQANKLYTDAFKGMEDALVNFVKTGKLDFKSMADSIISDLIRIQIQNNITKNLSAAVDAAGGFGGFFGSIASSIGSGIKNMLPSFDVGTDYVPNDMVAMVHKGEKIVPASQNAGSNGSTPVNINFNVQAIDANSFRSTLASNQNVIVGIVRQAFTKRAITSPI